MLSSKARKSIYGQKRTAPCTAALPKRCVEENALKQL